MRKLYTGLLLCLISLFLTYSGRSQTTYSFTTAGATGRLGPDQTQVNTAYGAGNTLNGKVTISTQGIQEWTVPVTGQYAITAAGASGGYTPSASGGKGRIITTEVTLTAGQVIHVLVGQEGGRAHFSVGYAGGGGGGSFIINKTTNTPLLIAGGGGGAGEGSNDWGSPKLSGVDASAYNITSGQNGTGYSDSWSSPGDGGTNGSGGTAFSGGSSAGGYTGNGQQGDYGGGAGTAYANGSIGGANIDICGGGFTLNVQGGFGGGAGVGICSNYEANAGGGGGYSGGGASNSRVGAGGGGGNLYTGTFISEGLNTGNGYVTIVQLFNGGTIGTNQTFCVSGTPAQFTSIAPAAGMPIASYQWQQSTDNNNWSDIANADALTYQAAIVSQTTYYRRKAVATDGSIVYSNIITVFVNPMPTVAAVTSQVLCNGSASAAVSFSGTVNGTDYSWTNSDPAIGLAASGTGTIASFNAVNTSAAPKTATITVTPSFTDNGATCTGTATTFTFTINPTTEVNAIANAEYCNNSAGAAIAFSTPVTGGTTTYAWTSSADIGFGTSGNGNIAAYTATNTGTSAITATVTVTPSFTNNGVTCSGTPSSFTIKVNPTPAATINYANSPYCNEAGSATPTFTGTTGGTYTSTTGLVIDATTGVVDTDASTPGTYTVTYTIAAAGGCAQVETTASIVIKEKTAITLQPAATQTVCAGNSVSFTVVTKGSAVTYQWYKGANPISNATASTFTIANPVAADAGNYNVVVTGDCGVITSSDAELKVNATTVIATQPVAEVKCVGSTATFSIVANGTALSYQWRKGATAITGATNATFTISSVSAADAGEYNVIVTGTCGVVTSANASLTVNALTAITTQPVAKVVCSGNSVTFNVAGVGTGLSYQWRKGSIAIAGANSSAYTIPATVIGDAGNYDVVVTGACGSVASTEVSLTVNATPATPTIAASGVTTFCAGGNVILTSSASAGNQWYKDGSAIIGADGSTYTVTSTGNYTVRTTANTCPSAMSAATAVNVTPLPAVPVITVTGNKLTSSAASNNQWFLNNTAINGAVNSIYTVRSSGLYTVQVTQNGCTSTSGVMNFVATSIDNPSTWNGEVIVYPNPAVKTLYIKNTGARKLQVQLFDGLGLKVYEAKVLSAQGIVDLQRFAGGAYQLRITDITKNETIQQTIIKL